MGLIVENVSREFITESVRAQPLNHVNLAIQAGEFVCLLGPSGCGKSTLLNIIAGLDTATEGYVSCSGRAITAPGPDRAVMFQESALFPWLRVIENVEFGMKMGGVPREIRQEIAMKYLKMVHLARFKDAFVHELSGGMRQRVALARALTQDSDVLLMDEPFAALDSQTRSILQLELQQIWQDTGKTIVFVTHNVEEAVMLADRVVVMSANPGRIKKEFRIQLARPRTIENTDVAFMTAAVMRVLKGEVETVAKAEYDMDWHLAENPVLSGPDPDLGSGL